MSMPLLDVHLLTWNGARYLPHLFQSLRAQTHRDWTLHIRDNASTDDTVRILEREAAQFPVSVTYTRNAENCGFAVGHNQLIAQAAAPFVLLLNQDTVLAPEYFTQLLEVLQAEPQAAAVQGVLLRWQCAADGSAGERTTTIDTLGLRVLRNRRVVEWHTGVAWPIPELALRDRAEVFGVSGALPMYRRAALADVAWQDEVFDAQFVSYKEDVDLAFRLRMAGWSAYLASRARAWHDRTAAGPRTGGDWAALQNRAGRSSAVRRYSFRNHLAVLIKNEYRVNAHRDWWAIGWYEWKKFAYLLCREPLIILGGLHDLWRMRHRLREQRAAIMRGARSTPAQMREWFSRF